MSNSAEIECGYVVSVKSTCQSNGDDSTIETKKYFHKVFETLDEAKLFCVSMNPGYSLGFHPGTSIKDYKKGYVINRWHATNLDGLEYEIRLEPFEGV